MKFYRYLLNYLLLVGCSTKTIQDDSLLKTTQRDSLRRANDTLTHTLTEADTNSTDYSDYSVSDDMYLGDDTLKIAIEYAFEQAAVNAQSRAMYSLQASFRGYENSSEDAYYFDSLFNLAYCTVNWSMESSSGSYTYYFENGELIAGDEDNYYNDSEEFVTLARTDEHVYGFYTTNGTEDDSGITYLYEDSYTSKNTEAKNRVQQLLARIREYQDTATVTEDVVTINIENIVNYGEDFIETESYEISRVLFDELIK